MAYKGNNGYKGMLRDRVPKIVDFALKWCKAKERWIDHVYDNFIKIVKGVEDRKKITRAILGLRKGKPKDFDFHRSVFWDQFDMSQQELEYWQFVEGWVNWFRLVFAYIECEYTTSHTMGIYKKDEFAKIISDKYLVGVKNKEKLAKYLIRCLEQFSK